MSFTIADSPTVGLPTPNEVQVPDTSVVAVIVTAGPISHQLHTGLMGTMLADIENRWSNYRGELIQTSGANISKARNEILRRFLDETDAEWAWMLDSDMVINPETLPRLLCAAEVSGAKAIGGLCCMKSADGPVPTIFQLGDPERGEVTRVMLDYPDNTLMQVAGTGAACLLVHRSVLEAMRDAHPERNYPWIFEDEIRGQWVSEDVLFTLRINEAGFPVFVDCTTHVGHVKGGDVWWPSDIRKGKGFPEPKTYAIIPSVTLELVGDMVEQLRGQVDQFVIIDNTDAATIHESDLHDLDDVHTMVRPGAGIHEMWNAGVDWALKDADQRRNVNLLILNDDLRVGPDFTRHMVDALRSDPNMVAVSGNYDNRRYPAKVQIVEDICAGRYDGTGGFAGFAFAVKGEWMQSGYRFPEECKWWYGDNDLVLAAKYSEVGKVGIAIDAEVVHLDGGGKTGGDWSTFDTDADRVAFENRWNEILNPPRQATVAVLSSIYGGYDTPVTPVAQDITADWIHVTDSTDPPPPPWRAIHKASDRDPRYAAKAAKYQPFTFTDADVAVWMDGRCRPASPRFLSWLLTELGDADMAIYRHWGRTSILDEAEACLIENPAKYAGHPMVEQAKHYLTDDYDDVHLWQSTFFAIRRNERTLTMGRRWQEEQDRFPDCLLDQIPLPPVIAECGVVVKDLPGGFWDHHGDLFVLEPHADGT